MRPRTVVAIALVLAVLVGGVVLGLTIEAQSGGSLGEAWTSDTATGITANHHSPAVGVVDGTPTVYAPISGAGGSDQCRLAGLHAGNGSTRWRYDVSPENCELHAVADPTLTDFDGDGEKEVLAATTEETITAHDSHTGDVEFRHELSTYGYTKPVVADLDDDGEKEVVVVDVRGTVVVVGADGTERWRDRLDTYTWGQPGVRDFDADGDLEVLVATEAGTVRLYGPDGDVEWERTDVASGEILWTTAIETGQPGIDVVVATRDGEVVALDGGDGATVWERTLGSYAAVHAVGDGDDDGDVEVYVAATGDGSGGTLWSLAAATGETEWTTTLTTEDVQMMPPPSLADLDGDDAPELVAVSNDGGVSAVDPDDGEVLAADGRNVPIYAHPTLADVDGDGAAEAYVVFGDGRVVAYEYEE